ncbi:MAG: hypothetical protein CME61_05425 [Halobacteriovoraceae bacterium]|nr:hypothetical protein [Halobacteriovoraceae bacterium]
MGSDQKRAFAALIVSGIFLFGWQKYFAPIDSKKIQDRSLEKPVVKDYSSNTNIKTNTKAVTERNIVPNDSLTNFEKFQEKLTFKKQSFVIDENMNVTNIVNSWSLFTFENVVGQDFSNSFIVNFNGIKVPLQISNMKKIGNSYVFDTNVPDLNLKISEFEKYINFNFISDKPFSLTTRLSSKPEQTSSGQIKKLKTYSSGEVSEVEFGDSEASLVNSSWYAYDFNYHLFAFLSDKETSFKISSNDLGEILIEDLNSSSNKNLSLLFIQKNYDELMKIGNGFSSTVEFGFFGFLAIPILRGLQFFHEYFPNYGVAIIILTIFIRLLTFPLQYKSFKSMKKMQKLQPELNKLKEKYKDNPQKMQAETMELFKRSGANPLGGCLPLLLQMPIFFAFYKVLSAAIELVGAPFIFWINDLSIKDPYFVLPVLLTVVMFLQQKITPMQTTDDTQKKVMLFMPIIFGFIMKDLPSGLVLYIFVSTLFGILQQLFVYKTVD